MSRLITEIIQKNNLTENDFIQFICEGKSYQNKYLKYNYKILFVVINGKTTLACDGYIQYKTEILGHKHLSFKCKCQKKTIKPENAPAYEFYEL